MNRYEIFVDNYSNCELCELHKTRSNIVHARGCVPLRHDSEPTDICFIGEKPGISEDALGEPFVGEDSRIMDQIIESALPTDMTYALTNLVCCLPPRIEGKGWVISDPDLEHIEACSQRLKDFIKLCNPKLIIAVGDVASDALELKYKNRIKFHKDIPVVSITHPAHIMRKKEIMQQVEIRRAIATILEAIEEIWK